MTESEEFYDIYKLNVVSIPTNKKMARKDHNDQIFRTEKEKYNAITKKIIECNDKWSASFSWDYKYRKIRKDF